jgi:hypothetical protein
MNTGLWNMDSGFAAPLGARVRAPAGWRICDAPGRPGMTIWVSALAGAAIAGRRTNPYR